MSFQQRTIGGICSELLAEAIRMVFFWFKAADMPDYR